MVSKVLLTLALLIAVIDAGPLCETRGNGCSKDVECACPGGSLICNWKNVCAEMGFWDRISRRKPCYRSVFKKRCSSHFDCACSEGVLVCEDHECVQPKPSLKA